MNYQTFLPDSDLAPLIKFYWTLEIPPLPNVERQLILPDGCIDMIFILADDIKRYTQNNEYIIQPRGMVLGQITEPFYVAPTGVVNSFAVRFYPYGFANFVTVPIKSLANTETPIEKLFGKTASDALTIAITNAAGTSERIQVLNSFLTMKLKETGTIDNIVKGTIDAILSTKGNARVKDMVKDDLSKRRQLERRFLKTIGISPRQLGKVIRLQSALRMLLNRDAGSLTDIAYENDYYDQAHFIKDFKEFTGTTPRQFLADDRMVLSSLLYKNG